MREIKFRAWDGKKIIVNGDRWYPAGVSSYRRHPEAVQISNLGIHYTKLCDAEEKTVNVDGRNYYGNWDGDGVHSEGIAIMQFTGLTDKNGVDIYEGDLLGQHGAGIGFVVFDNGAFCLDCRSETQTTSRLVQDRTRKLEVLANLFEAPKLLEVTE